MHILRHIHLWKRCHLPLLLQLLPWQRCFSISLYEQFIQKVSLFKGCSLGFVKQIVKIFYMLTPSRVGYQNGKLDF
ncbi:hypothetical protein PHAVU_002G167600 [Phaseolus vulgaris]|uniref:Secreted protein n=1 Tax=Phaseolus vulgaris TaxID=3885 RepID=V7CMY0_PHAVU|nr:hypothetical protein PHAVU_002G167600g [Phaseolus vulgaris]ESW30610.1 hypothetical protein PHAVU_002G167600g [Phaseolus vulgaris]